jgi:hypothetical protein
MSALPARVTELPPASPATVAPPTRAERRAERRAQLKRERRSRRRWAIVSCSVMLGVFGLTVGILDVMH